MNVADVVTLLALAFAIYAIYRGRKRGRERQIANLNALHASIEGAHAAGRAEMRAELAAVANAHGGSVVLQLGSDGSIGHPARGTRAHYDDDRDAAAGALPSGHVHQLEPVRGSDGGGWGAGVGGVLDGVQRGSHPADGDRGGVRADRAGGGDVPGSGGPEVMWGRNAAGRVTE